MIGNGVEISLIFHGTLGPLVLDWAPNHIVLGAQLAPDKKRLVCIPVKCALAHKLIDHESVLKLKKCHFSSYIKHFKLSSRISS